MARNIFSGYERWQVAGISPGMKLVDGVAAQQGCGQSNNGHAPVQLYSFTVTVTYIMVAAADYKLTNMKLSFESGID